MAVDQDSALFADCPNRAAVERALVDRFPWARPKVELDRCDLTGQAVDWTWRGKYGHAYSFNDELIGIVVESRQVAERLRRLGRWSVLQDGDLETTLLVPDAEFREVGKLVGLRQRRRLSAAQQESALAGLRKAGERARRGQLLEEGATLPPWPVSSHPPDRKQGSESVVQEVSQ